MAPSSRLVYGKDDALFGCIERIQGERPFGSVLDAGTGLHSLRWIATLRDHHMTGFCAITADTTMQRNVQLEAEALQVDDVGEILEGNWFSSSDGTNGDHSQDHTGPIPRLLHQRNQQFDVILADYLIGAMDGFSPYKQQDMVPLLSQFLKPDGGRLYIVGLEPLPDAAPGPANVVCRVRQVRDACILLAGHRCYREYPLQWVTAQVEATPHLRLVDTYQFPILYSYETILKQINVGRSKLKLFPNTQLANAMARSLDELDAEAKAATLELGRIPLGFDYVVAAERVMEDM